MKMTEPLSVIGDFSFGEDQINIHPNDGFDLGLMTAQYAVTVFLRSITDGEAGTGGTIFLKNECRVGTVELSLKTAKALGNPKRVRLGYDNGKLLIQTV